MFRSKFALGLKAFCITSLFLSLLMATTRSFFFFILLTFFLPLHHIRSSTNYFNFHARVRYTNGYRIHITIQFSPPLFLYLCIHYLLYPFLYFTSYCYLRLFSSPSSTSSPSNPLNWCILYKLIIVTMIRPYIESCT